MWRDRFDMSALEDAKIAKAIRSDFIAEYCRAVFVALIGTKAEIERLEARVIAITPPENRWWNGRTDVVYEEPTALLDQLLERRGCDESRRAAIMRQPSELVDVRSAGPVEGR